jgi:hypothetical protein
MPRGLPRKVKTSLSKARESALLAVEIYNKPATEFKTGGFIVMMVVAWTSLFHTIFFRRKIKPYYKEDNNYFYKKIDGEYWYWELRRCLKEYFGNDTQNPIRLNLDLFIKLRNKIEHKSLPKIDPDIFAECQAMLLNFDEILRQEFGEDYCISEMLSFSLQLSPNSESLSKASLSKEEQKVINFIHSYRSAISTDVIKSGKFSFKAFLIQVANHNSKDALPIQFIQYDKLDESEKKNVERVAMLVKEKLKKVPVRNPNSMLPKEVVKKVQNRLGNPKIKTGRNIIDLFNSTTHTRCWKKYGVRPKSSSDQPEKTIDKFCIYDDAFETYMYKPKWIDFLVEKMSDKNEYCSLYKGERDIVEYGALS